MGKNLSLTEDDKQNYRLALEEANRYVRFLDNFYWIISSFVMVGSGYGVFIAFKWDGEKWQLIPLSLIMIIKWIFFLLYTKFIYDASMFYINRVNHFEKELGIDILPDFPDKKQRGLGFRTIMIIVACLSILLWYGLLLEFVFQNWCNLCTFVMIMF